MRSPAQGSIVQTLANQITVKGSYKHSLAGTYFDLVVVSPNGEILGNQCIAVRQRDRAGCPNERIEREISRVAAALKHVRADTYHHFPAQEQAVKYVLRVLFPRTN